MVKAVLEVQEVTKRLMNVKEVCEYTDLLIMMNDKHINNDPNAQEMQMYHIDEVREMMTKDEID